MYSQRRTIKKLYIFAIVYFCSLLPKTNILLAEHTFVNKKPSTVQINISSLRPFPLWKANLKMFAHSRHVFEATFDFLTNSSIYECWNFLTKFVKFGVIKALKIDYSFKNSFEQTVSRQPPQVCWNFWANNIFIPG